MEERLKNIVKALETFANERGGDLAIGFQNGCWSVALTWGREAPDSPMAGAQALGSGPFLEEALIQVAEEAHVELPVGGDTDVLRGEVVLVAGAGDQRSIVANYDPSCKLVQFVQYGEEVFGTLEPVEPEEWQQIVDRLGRAAPFMQRVLVLVQAIERAAEGAEPVPDLQQELRAALRQFAGSIEPEQVVEVAHAADKITWEKLLDGDSAVLIRLGHLVFVWAKDASTIKVVRAEPVEAAVATAEDLELDVAFEIDVPPELGHHDAEAFETFCREFVGVGGNSIITADEAANLFAAYTGGVVDSALFDSVTPKLEAIAGKELVP